MIPFRPFLCLHILVLRWTPVLCGGKRTIYNSTQNLPTENLYMYNKTVSMSWIININDIILWEFLIHSAQFFHKDNFLQLSKYPKILKQFLEKSPVNKIQCKNGEPKVLPFCTWHFLSSGFPKEKSSEVCTVGSNINTNF